MVMGIRFAFGVVYVGILDDTGWSRADTAGIFSASMAVYALTVTFSGALFDRLGPRKLFSMAFIILAGGLYLSSIINTLWQFYLAYGVVVGVSFSLLGFPTHMAVVPRWFIRKRGFASALALSGTGIGSMLMSIFTENLIEQIGWRGTYQLYAVIVILFLIPLNLLFQRDHPETLGLLPDGKKQSEQSQSATTRDHKQGVTLLQALKTPAWWYLFIGVTMIGFTSMTMVVHQTRLTLDYGYTLIIATTFFGLTGLSRSLGGLLWGPLSDRIGRKGCFFIGAFLGFLGLVFLYFAQYSPNIMLLLGFSLVFGGGYMGITPVYASTVGDLFSGRHLGKIISMLDIGFGTGSAIGPWLAGYLFDRQGSYDLVLMMMMAGAAITGLCLHLSLSTRPKKPLSPLA